ncbi:MAG: InlB B-repeat-containing protein, partial [Paludibacteraceae bacterium]|nr:InlB B-repeat-containing protein [Paludibacteraceae bacterium]
MINISDVKSDVEILPVVSYEFDGMVGDSYRDCDIIRVMYSGEAVLTVDSKIIFMSERTMPNDDGLTETVYPLSLECYPSGVNGGNRSFSAIVDRYVGLSIESGYVVNVDEGVDMTSPTYPSSVPIDDNIVTRYWYLYFHKTHFFPIGIDSAFPLYIEVNDTGETDTYYVGSEIGKTVIEVMFDVSANGGVWMDGSSAPVSTLVTEGNDVYPPKIPDNDKLRGWSKDPRGESGIISKDVAIVAGTDSVRYYALYDSNSGYQMGTSHVNVTFNVSRNGGKWSDNSTMEYQVEDIAEGSNVNLPNAPVAPSGTVFLGWNTNPFSDFGYPQVVYAPNVDTTYYAIYGQKPKVSGQVVNKRCVRFRRDDVNGMASYNAMFPSEGEDGVDLTGVASSLTCYRDSLIFGNDSTGFTVGLYKPNISISLPLSQMFSTGTFLDASLDIFAANEMEKSINKVVEMEK